MKMNILSASVLFFMFPAVQAQRMQPHPSEISKSGFTEKSKQEAAAITKRLSLSDSQGTALSVIIERWMRSIADLRNEFLKAPERGSRLSEIDKEKKKSLEQLLTPAQFAGYIRREDSLNSKRAEIQRKKRGG